MSGEVSRPCGRYRDPGYSGWGNRHWVLRRTPGRPAADAANPYVVDDQGRICRRTCDDAGVLTDEPLCNFSARIVEEVVVDDGAETTTCFGIEGRLSSGTALAPVEVRSDEYEGVDWVPGGMMLVRLLVRRGVPDACRTLAKWALPRCLPQVACRA